MTDEGGDLIAQIINSLSPRCFIVQPDVLNKPDVSKRIGIGNTDHFDNDNDEIAGMYTGGLYEIPIF